MAVNAAGLRGVLDTVEGKLVSVRERARETAGAVREVAQEVRESAGVAAAEMEGARRKVEGSAEALRRQVIAASGEIQGALADLGARQATVLDDLRRRLEEAPNQWNLALLPMIAALEDGSITFERFLRLAGEWELRVGDGTQKIRDFLASLDPREFENRVQHITRLLRDGQLSAAQIIEQLSGLQNRYAEELVKVYRLFLQNKATLEEVLRKIRQAQAGFDGGDGLTSTLAGGLEDLLRRAQLGGEI